jgi:hypothetical protein
MKVFFLVVLAVVFTLLAFGQEVLTPEQQVQMQGIGIMANILAGVVITWVISRMKGKFPFIKDAITVVISSLMSVFVLYVFDLVLGWGVWKDASFFLNVVTALGINQTVSSLVWELFKKKTPVVPK